MLFFNRKKTHLMDLFTDAFVDIHSHLLPGIDDGAKDIHDSLGLIASLAEVGIKNFITTPHVLGDVYPNSSAAIKKQLDKISQALTEKKMSDITMSAAAEYMLDEQFQELLKEGDILTLQDNYILVEMSYFSAPLNVMELIFEIQLKGYKPILAHPERYNFYHQDINNYYKLKSAGCLFQLNLLSLSQHYGKNVYNTAQQLLNENLYDFVGTDTHHNKHIALLKSIKLGKELKKVEALISKNAAFLTEK